VNTNNNQLNQMPPIPMASPPMLVQPMSQGGIAGTQRFISNNRGRILTVQQERTVPLWLTSKSAVFFFVAMIACWAAYGFMPEFTLWIIASISVVLFFYGCSSMSRSLSRTSERHFVRNVFIVGFIIRLLWVLYCYFFFNPEYYNNVYGDDADTGWYMDFGRDFADWFRGQKQISFGRLMDDWTMAVDDMGYPIWLAIVYFLTFGSSDVFIPFVVKSALGAYCAVSIYRIAKRHYGVGVGRMAALFVIFNPNMIFWCASMMKEAEMVFLCCLCVDLVDRTFTSGQKLSFKGLLPGVLVGMVLFFFRAPLAIVLFLAMFAHIVMASGKVMGAGKKIIAGLMVGVVLLIGMGDSLRTQAESIVEDVQSDKQNVNMEWRAERKGGNAYAKYASAAIFAPLIFTIPFPTFNAASSEQIIQQILSGGNYIKNILSFFVIYVIIVMLLSGEWRRHVFILAYTLGYLACLVLSSFAHSSRFHMPIWPFLLLFAALGIQMGKTTPRIRRWYPIVLAVEVVACLAWNWFKLKGRGMI